MAGTPYFPGQEPQLVAKLDGYLDHLRLDLKQKPDLAAAIAALVLAGGYGRGEGGIFRRDNSSTSELYNDLEFYLIAHPHAPFRLLQDWCTQHAHYGDRLLGIEVEFKILRTPQLEGGSPSMFYYDLLSAHCLVFGSDTFMASLPAKLRDSALIPSEEATRLLFNRGTGLFFSRVALEENSDLVQNGFIERNHAKVRLALADAVLALNGFYHYSCLERQQRLDRPMQYTPPDWPLLREWHKLGVEFKLHPRHLQPTAVELNQTQIELCEVWMRTFLWLESIRLHKTFHSPADYAFHTGRLYPQSPLWKNLALTVRDGIKRGAMLPGILDYPRAALQRALVLLLQPPPSIAKAGRLLGLHSNPSLSQIRDAYRRWWGYYN